MILQLKQINGGWPPGGWAWKDPRTGWDSNGMENTLEGQITKAINHRVANPNVYPPGEPEHFDREHVRQEIFRQLHAKHPQVFVGYDMPLPKPANAVVYQQPKETCRCGSKEWVPIYCKSCGGAKITGWKCKSCSKEKGT